MQTRKVSNHLLPIKNQTFSRLKNVIQKFFLEKIQRSTCSTDESSELNFPLISFQFSKTVQRHFQFIWYTGSSASKVTLAWNDLHNFTYIMGNNRENSTPKKLCRSIHRPFFIVIPFYTVWTSNLFCVALDTLLENCTEMILKNISTYIETL